MSAPRRAFITAAFVLLTVMATGLVPWLSAARNLSPKARLTIGRR